MIKPGIDHALREQERERNELNIKNKKELAKRNEKDLVENNMLNVEVINEGKKYKTILIIALIGVIGLVLFLVFR